MCKNKNNTINNKNRGAILIQLLVFSTLSAVLITALANWSAVNLRAGRKEYAREVAFQVAEAGIDYYRWHLAQAPLDFTDGTGESGPYIHDYKDKNGNIIGSFSLEIFPPEIGTTKVTVTSTGKVLSDPNIFRKIEVQFAKPSLSKFAVITENTIRFEEGTEVFGPIHSNGGIRFDGFAHNIISSSLTDYNDPDHFGNKEFAVHTHVSPVDPNPPSNVPVRNDVFGAGRQFPVPAIDFGKFTNDLSEIKTKAQEDGLYFSSSGKSGYHVILKIDDTLEVYKVTALISVPQNCTQPLGQFGWGTWSIKNEEFIGSYDFPPNGLLFLEDHVWVEGQIDTARLTIAVGKFPENQGQERNITVNNNLLYTNYDGRDGIGLIAQGNINAGMVSADVLRIDAALIAKNDRVGRYYYSPPSDKKDRCSPYHIRDTITLYGSLATNKNYGFSYEDGTGYQNINIIYDANLLWSAPPDFPLTTDQYQITSWKEIK